MDNGTYSIQDQQFVPQLIQQVIGVVLLVVLVAWGFGNIRKSIRGEPMEELPFEIPYGS